MSDQHDDGPVGDEPPFDDEPPPDLAPDRNPRRQRSGMRVPPHNLDAEAAVLGAMLLSQDAIASAAEVIPTPEVFYRPAHAHIFEAILVLTTRGDVADPITVADELRRRDLLEAAGGKARLVDLQAAAPGTANAAHYARIVRDHFLLRRLIGAAGTIAERAYGVPEDVHKALDEAESLVFDIGGHALTDQITRLDESMGEVMERIEALVDRGSEVTGTTTGFYDLDELTAGLQPGALIVLGARPSMGKTSLALNIATNAAKSGETTLFFSLEMSKIELGMRVLGGEARVDSKKLKNGKVTDQDWTAIANAIGRVNGWPLFLDDSAATTVMDIRTKARRVKREEGGLGLIVIDYIQLMEGRGRTAESRQVEVSEISRGLKLLARELECPVIALAQLNRGLEQRSDKRPLLSDLRESGSLEQDSDVVMFVYRDEVYEPTTENQGLAEIIVAKHRNGPTGIVRLSFLAHLTRFESMPRDM